MLDPATGAKDGVLRVTRPGYHTLSELEGEMAWLRQIEQTYVDPRRFPRFLENDLTGSIFDLLRDGYGVAMARVEEKIEVVAARGKSACYLEKEEGYPVLRVVYQATDDAGAAAVVSKDVYNPDLVCLTVVGQR